MQTFLPFPDFEDSARVLDDRRLGKQRVEAFQILRALRWEKYGWKHHPAVLMWEGYEEALGCYGHVVCREWQRRGRADTVEEKITAELGLCPRPQAELAALGLVPAWVGDETIHRSHRSALLRKDPELYRLAFPDVPDDLGYVWPVRRGT